MTDRAEDDAHSAEVRLNPPPSEWSRLIEQSWQARGGAPRAQRFREQLGLPTDQPVVMTGHQAVFWHPGVLAKFFAADSAARASGAAAAWIIPDQDERAFETLRVPVRDQDGRLLVRRVEINDPPAGAAGASCPAFRPRKPALDAEPALPSVKYGLDQTVEALDAHAQKPSAAEQVAAADAELLKPLLEPAPTIFASDLHCTDLFNDLLDRMRRRPRDAIETYNEAAEAHPSADLAPMVCDEARGRCEFPLWRLQRGQPRRAVFLDELPKIPREQLAPRALLMTALLRLAGCDLFIHGTGGAEYDAATEAWIERWLDENLAPRATVTATLTLPLTNDAPGDAEIARAVWFAHYARHNPSALDADEHDRRKREHLKRIEKQRERGESAWPEFHAMHEDLSEYRRERADALRGLDEEARRLRARAGEREIASDRTWPFPWHDDAALRALQRRMDTAFEPQTSSARTAG